MSGFSKWITALLTVILVALLVLIAALQISQWFARRAIPEDGRLTLRQDASEGLTLSWPSFGRTGSYFVEVSALNGAAKKDEMLLFSAVCETTECKLPSILPGDVPVMLRVTPLKDLRFLEPKNTRFASAALSVSCYLNPPKAELTGTEMELESETLRLRWSGWKGDRYRLYKAAADGSLQLFRELDGLETELCFGETPELAVPEHGETVRFVLEPVRETPELLFFGAASDYVVSRSDFLGTTLTLSCFPVEDNSCFLTWNESKGVGYKILMRRGGEAEETVLATLDPAAERVYRTGHLDPYTDYTFRIVAFNDPHASLDDCAAASDPVTMKTGAQLLYATVWSLQDLDVYSALHGTEKIGVMRAAEAYCVLSETDGWLEIATPAFAGYVDGNRCMINLPDYVGALCSYDIANSDSSVFRIHDYDIAGVTDTTVSGYESVRLSDGSYLVPLLYPTAKKLIAAAEAAAADGYRLKIYDAFRPNQATRSVYDLTASILFKTLPAQSGSGAAGGGSITYFQLMTNNVYGINSFLASSGSRHNYGVAVDLTLETLADGSELQMQTSMHDLSWYSSVSRNNENANLLRQYMTGNGFAGLNSEWWHFQDDSAFASYRLSNRWSGVQAAGWTRDDGGWRCRLADGSFCTEAEKEIGGVLYRFSPDGYLLDGEA